MAKKEKKQICDEMPPWMITFSDVMTLMLTFFVLLVSMSQIDARRKLVALGSIIGTFGFNQASYEVFSKKDTRRTVEPGPIDTGDLEPLKELKWENVDDDINFRSNRFVQILSINSSLLFGPDGTTLSQEGEATLDRFMPVLIQVQYPLLLAGHTAELRDELGLNYQPGDDEQNPDISWKISLGRSLAVYRFLLDRGMRPDQLRVEAFGKFMPYYPQNTAENRAKNRRVDIVLDKRNTDATERIRELTPSIRQPVETLDVNGFEFRIGPTDGEQ
ncbi:OmpA/MotB domain protein [Pseudodesulfovibrio profundus]|uniref:OmpA/MotB domain protein n=1 Tax=Pseudodesulfovibrio profundus TaxID=57320 RepID=A0A2C8F7J9_9BACT|nr:flagellar motor protein MotB [Pseudodesulfovibrio profundus]MBC17345.1 flagellar motor protein MotB [Desulfovibrio sp.]SOB58616.1 OmpA/MotB domain protein [Pseudodesulfovibrio profundus]|tara:strand:+ start:729 stop:1550 length:822 start_codon:yes stop_codon:yes gene_type:complete